MEQKKIVINGNNFSTLDEFFDEAERILTTDLGWRTGHNFSAFHDLLRGGFGVFDYGESVCFVWENSQKSRRDLGYDETARYYERLLEKCAASNRPAVLEKLARAKSREGATLFDMIAAQIAGNFEDYEHTLELR